MTIKQFLKALKHAPNGWHVQKVAGFLPGIRNSEGSCPIIAMTGNSGLNNGRAIDHGRKYLGLSLEDSIRIVQAADSSTGFTSNGWISMKILRLRLKWALGIPLWK